MYGLNENAHASMRTTELYVILQQYHVQTDIQANPAEEQEVALGCLDSLKKGLNKGETKGKGFKLCISGVQPILLFLSFTK